MHHPLAPIRHRIHLTVMSLAMIAVALAPDLAVAQATSPFMTGATALQTNILAWLTPIAIILIMVLGGMAMANRIAQVSSTYGAGEAQTLVENCGNTLILRCSGSEHGGTSQFASKLIGEREILRNQISRGSDRDSAFPKASGRRSRNVSVQHVIEPSVLPSEIEQLTDLSGFFKPASSPFWLKTRFGPRGRMRGGP